MASRYHMEVLLLLLHILRYRTLQAASSITPANIILFWKSDVRPLQNDFFNFCFFWSKISKNDLKWLRTNKILQKLIYSNFVFLTS